jgi:hypothetical protein
MGILPVIDGVKDEFTRKVIGGAATLYVQNSVFPTAKEIYGLTRVPIKYIVKVLESDVFETAMQERGIPTRETGLTARQMYALSLLADPHTRKTVPQRLRTAGISMNVYKAWLARPEFADAVHRLAENSLGQHMHSVHESLLREAIKGNMKAIEYYYSMTGRHDTNKQQVIDVMQILAKAVEVIQTYVKDPIALELIANEMKRIGEAHNLDGKVPGATLRGEVVYNSQVPTLKELGIEE